jgi:hypothetical protein
MLTHAEQDHIAGMPPNLSRTIAFIRRVVSQTAHTTNDLGWLKTSPRLARRTEAGSAGRDGVSRLDACARA